MRMPSPATAIALLALTASVGGGSAYAATKLAANSVGSREIKPRSIRLSDLALEARPMPRARLAQAITEVVTDPATGINIRVTGERGEKGDAGPQGANGPTGPAGAPSIQHVTVREAVSNDIDRDREGGATARCEPGEDVIGGGGRFVGGTGIQTSSAPLDGGEAGWVATFSNPNVSPGRVHAYAICAEVLA